MTAESALKEFDELVDAIEAGDAVWALGDWLAANVPPSKGGRPSKNPELGFRVSLTMLAERSDLSERWLRQVRTTAETTKRNRLPGVSVRVYAEALKGRTLAQANALLLKQGSRLRDVGPPMESIDSVKRNLRARSPQEQAEVVRDLIEEADEATTDAIAHAVSGSDAGGYFGAVLGLAQDAKAQKHKQEHVSKGGRDYGAEMAQDQIYDAISDGVYDIYLRTQSIARAIRNFDGQHDADKLDRSIERLDAAVYLITQCRDALQGARAIDIDELVADIQEHINAR